MSFIDLPEIGTLAGRAMLVDLDVHSWDPFKTDRKITSDVHQKHNTTGTYSKRLLPKSAMSKLSAARGVVESTHKLFTLPWNDRGERIIDSAAVPTYKLRMNQAIQDYNNAAAELAVKFVELVDEMERTEKNGSFNRAYYPKPEEFLQRFSVEIHWSPVPEGNDLRVKLSDDMLAAIKTSIDGDQQNRLQTAIMDVAFRIKDVVGHMVNRLKEFKPAKNGKAESRLYDSMVDNIWDLADVLPFVNITGSPAIDTMAEELRDLAESVPLETLKSDAKARANTIKQAEKILEKISDFI